MASTYLKSKNDRNLVEIDREALLKLEEARGSDETISEVIKRCVYPRQSAEEILGRLRESKISMSTLKLIEQSAKRRRRTGYKSKG